MENVTKADQAAALFKAGFNCAQSVSAVFCEAYGADPATVAKIATGMGGGFRCGEFCGALSGAVLIVGLAHGQTSPENKAAKTLCYAKTVEMTNAFRARHGSCRCRELLGCDISTPEGWQQAQPLFATVCTDLIRSAVQLLEEQGY